MNRKVLENWSCCMEVGCYRSGVGIDVCRDGQGSWFGGVRWHSRSGIFRLETIRGNVAIRRVIGCG